MQNDNTRFNQAMNGYKTSFNHKPSDLFIAPGRVEIIGNHTDHQHGKTLSMTIDRYIYAAASKNNDHQCISFNRGYPEAIVIDLKDLRVKEEEFGSSMGLIRGVYAYFANHGYRYGGLNFYSISTILRGMGLSSSAAFEVLIAKMLNHYYNDNQISPLEIAKASQFAEQVYFNKPCGLLDQLTISYGGVVYSDFNETSPVQANLTSISQDLFFYVINTGKSHAKLTGHYAEITSDLANVSAQFEKKLLIDVDEQAFDQQYASLKPILGERPLNRARHIFDENKRVIEAFNALSHNDSKTLLSLMRASGLSSRNLLQNLSYPGDKDRRLIRSFDRFYKATEAGVRVNGGGFAGTLIIVSDEPSFEEKLLKISQSAKLKVLPVSMAKYPSGHVKTLP